MVTDVIVLELLSAWFAHPNTPQPGRFKEVRDFTEKVLNFCKIFSILIFNELYLFA